MVTAKHKLQKLVFNLANQKLVDFLDELRKLAKDAIRIAAHIIIEQFKFAKMPPHLRKLINQAHLENGTYEQVVTHPEKELELNGLEAPDDLQINTVSQSATNTVADEPKTSCHHCEIPSITEISVACWKDGEKWLKTPKIISETRRVAPTTLFQTIKPTTITKKQYQSQKKAKKIVYPLCETCRKTNHSTEKS